MRRWVADLLLGARMAVAGGPSGVVRAGLTALGVGLGVATLLLSASVINILESRQERTAARDDLSFSGPVELTDRSILVAYADTAYRDQSIRGRLLQPEGANPAVPPGLATVPKPGELVVSPALADLLRSAGGALLRERLDYPIVSTIADNGLSGPAELAFYLGSDSLRSDDDSSGYVVRRNQFGEERVSDGLPDQLLLLVIVAFVVLLFPVALFVAASIRFGGESRDRRLAGVRLVGADAAMARRIAAGEALLSAILGVATGAAMFAIGRTFISGIELMEISAFASDVRPDPILAVLVAIGVPAAAVAVTVLSLRRVVIEPLGVVRRGGDAKRQVWWRLVLPIAGLALLAPLAGQVGAVGEAGAVSGAGAVSEAGGFNETQVIAGICLLLIGVATLLPWVVQRVVGRLRGGPVAWQLATRRMQLDGSTSARAVTGVAVAVAGAIGLQIVFAALEDNFTRSTGMNTNWAQMYVSLSPADGWAGAKSITAQLRDRPEVTDVFTTSTLLIEPSTTAADASQQTLDIIMIADCQVLLDAATMSHCADGDVFLLDGTATLTAGTDVNILDDAAEPVSTWSIPADTATVSRRPDAVVAHHAGVLATPGALSAELRDVSADTTTSYLRLDPAVPDAVDRVRNAVWAIDPLGYAGTIAVTERTRTFDQIRRGIYIGAAVTMLLVGASLLVNVLEQLRDRRRLLAILVAFGTRRRTLAWSILWQTAVPVALGVALATATGLLLGTALLRSINEPITVDWSIVATMSGIAAAIVVLVTALSTPLLLRLMRADGLRTE